MSTINLLPKDHAERRIRHRATLLCLGLFAVVMAGVITAAVVSQQSGRRTVEVRNRVNASYAHAAQLIAQMQELEAKKLSLCRKASTTASLVERVPRSTLLAIVTNALPEGASLTKFDLTTKTVKPAVTDATRASKKKRGKNTSKFEAAQAKDNAPPPEAVVEMKVVGLAQNDLQVARFMAGLIRNRLLAEVDLVVSQEKMIDKAPLREFEVKMRLRPNADAAEIVKPPQGGAPTKDGTAAGEKSLAKTGAQGELP